MAAFVRRGDRLDGENRPDETGYKSFRAQLINIAARITRSARQATLRLPAAWRWATAWLHLFTAAIGPPTIT